jgi:hypothetical protein
MRLLVRLLTWPLVAALLGAGFFGAYKVHQLVQAERAAEAAGDKVDVPKRVEPGAPVVKLGAELADSLGLKDEPARAVTWQESVPVFGRVVPNPRAASEVRAAFAGTLRAAPGHNWPAPACAVHGGQVLGWLDVRFGPQERLDLQAKLTEARLKQAGAEEVLRIQQERADRLKPTSRSAVVAQSELDEALVKVTEARTLLATSREAVRVWEEALAEIDKQGEHKSATWSQRLTAPADGEVTELLGRPGMAVEAGGLIARLVDFRQVLVRLDIPAEALSAGPPKRVELAAAQEPPPGLRGATNRPEPAGAARTVTANLAGVAPQVDPVSQLAGYLYEADFAVAQQSAARVPAGVRTRPEEFGGWRPGLLVKATLRVPRATPRPAVAVPLMALLYHQGRALVYVRVRPGRYERREVQVLGRDGDTWVLAGGVTAGEAVVFKQAQVLLSEEFRGDVDND